MMVQSQYTATTEMAMPTTGRPPDPAVPAPFLPENLAARQMTNSNALCIVVLISGGYIVRSRPRFARVNKVTQQARCYRCTPESHS
mmetsp:Transcript_3853/g.7695  ORF Transcript_3853/g.7695 Transcript_3853/m.7695 type:complete len:86 (-) Transcript_3853:250-507(-)